MTVTNRTTYDGPRAEVGVIGGSGLYSLLEAAETVDASNSKDKAKQVDFGAALAAAIQKKEVPVTVVTDKSKSTWTIHSISAQREDRYRHKSHQDSGSRGVRWQLYTVLRHDSGHRQ
jgi:hypothetical protein